MNESELAELKEILRKRRPHAAYFHFTGDKAGTEASVVEDWVQARHHRTDGPYVKMESLENPFDPPDVVLTDENGDRHGFEVVEFVDRETIRAAVNKRPVDDKEYGEQEFRALIADLITRKAHKPFKDASCVTKRLIIYSDETIFIAGDGLEFLSRFPAVHQSYFDEVWLMIPPPPTDSDPTAVSLCRIFEIKKS